MSAPNNARVPQDASAEEVAQLIAALDRTSLLLSDTRVTLSLDGTFTLHIPIGSFVVSSNPLGVAAPTVSDTQADPVTAPTTVTAVNPQLATPAINPILNNIGPTPAELIEGLAQRGDSGGKWYCVTRGLDVGVFKHLDEVSPLTLSVPTSALCKHDSQALAVEAYIRSWNNGHIRRL